MSLNRRLLKEFKKLIVARYSEEELRQIVVSKQNYHGTPILTISKGYVQSDIVCIELYREHIKIHRLTAPISDPVEVSWHDPDCFKRTIDAAMEFLD